jgi:hypothetical protein
MVATDNPLFTLFLHVIAIEGYYKITVSLNIHVMNFRSSQEIVSSILLTKDEAAMPTEA